MIEKRNRAILKRRDSIDGIRDCQDCFATKNVPVSFFLGRHCYLDCANICYRYGKYKRYYAEEKMIKNVSKEKLYSSLNRKI